MGCSCGKKLKQNKQHTLQCSFPQKSSNKQSPQSIQFPDIPQSFESLPNNQSTEGIQEKETKIIETYPLYEQTITDQQIQENQENPQQNEQANEQKKEMIANLNELLDFMILLFGKPQNRNDFNENHLNFQKTENEKEKLQNRMKDQSEFEIEDNPNQGNSFIAMMNGRPNTLHEGARYVLEILIHEDHPNTAPFVWFRGIVPFHCNVGDNGRVCTEYINKWKPSYCIYDLLINITNMLYKPNKDSPLSKNFVITEEGKEKCRRVAIESNANNLKYIFEDQ